MTLFLLTKTYPYGTGEQYVSNELRSLAKAFKKVVIYPNDFFGNEEQHTKPLPANVEVLNFNNIYQHYTARIGIKDYLFLFFSTVQEFFLTDDKRSFFKNFKWNLVNFWTQYQLAIAFSVYLRKNDLPQDSCVFYSYWFHKSAILLSIMKKKSLINGYVSRAHSVDLYHNDWGIINEKIKVPPYKLFKLKNVSKLYAVSKHGYNYLNTKFPHLSSRFNYSYLGVEPITRHSSERFGEQLFHMVSCSGLDSNKRVHLLARAMVQLNQPFKWTHFGDGPFRDEIEKLIPSFPPGSSVVIKGQMPNPEIIKFYAENRVDLFVNLSLVEGLPVSIMEAMMFGIPVLATSVYGTPEAVVEGYSGTLIPSDFSIEELSDKLFYCLSHREELKKMGHNAQLLFEEKFNAETNYIRFAQLLKS